ncbi:N-acetyltransferase [Bacillus sp. HMF5848]|uniref:GNAT family N-acetyltransferase n=1 Tax=Bacillus sp. HMF5848 TaxID=2495421 RepID=UPI000F7ABD2E|nr:GNAT family N-acetyltransferase [Bacillus sp. HMF5848]RSK27678.1 N-acetyltransferase [Bacillus sp. HMF5848]
MNMTFRKPTKEDAEFIATWKYEGDYSFYNNDKTEAKLQWAQNIYKEDNTFVICDECDNVLGNCSFELEDNEYILGVQMNPSFTGQGSGTEFVSHILQFGKETFNYESITLFVATFNKRAIRIYDKLGFKTTDSFIANANNEITEFVVMKKSVSR